MPRVAGEPLRLGARDPSNTMWQYGLSYDLQGEGDSLVALDRRPEAMDAYGRAADISTELAQLDGGSVVLVEELTLVLERVAPLGRRHATHEKAIGYAERSVRAREQLLGASPGSTLPRLELIRAQLTLGALQLDGKDVKGAGRSLGMARSQSEPLRGDETEATRETLALLEVFSGELALASGDRAAAPRALELLHEAEEGPVGGRRG